MVFARVTLLVLADAEAMLQMPSTAEWQAPQQQFRRSTTNIYFCATGDSYVITAGFALIDGKCIFYAPLKIQEHTPKALWEKCICFPVYYIIVQCTFILLMWRNPQNAAQVTYKIKSVQMLADCTGSSDLMLDFPLPRLPGCLGCAGCLAVSCPACSVCSRLSRHLCANAQFECS